jgi:hypothetical protein
MGRLQAALRDGVEAFCDTWKSYADTQEKHIAERYLKKQEQRNEVVQAAYATLSANDQHFLMHFTENLVKDERPDHAHVKRVLEIIEPWPLEAKMLMTKELVARCPQMIRVSCFTNWVRQYSFMPTSIPKYPKDTKLPVE